VLAAQFCVSPATVHTWKQRADTSDRCCRPHTTHFALCDQEEAMVLYGCVKAANSLDDLLEAAEPHLPHLRRSSLHRLLVRHGCNRLPKKEQQATGQPGTFKEYGPGFLHIDCFYLPKLDGQKHYCFVAIDRATRLVFLWVYGNKDKEAATDFLKRCLAFYPFKVQKILTGAPFGSNGREFTLNGFKNRWAPKQKRLIFSLSYARTTILSIVKPGPTHPKPMEWWNGPMA